MLQLPAQLFPQQLLLVHEEHPWSGVGVGAAEPHWLLVLHSLYVLQQYGEVATILQMLPTQALQGISMQAWASTGEATEKNGRRKNKKITSRHNFATIDIRIAKERSTRNRQS